MIVNVLREDTRVVRASIVTSMSESAHTGNGILPFYFALNVDGIMRNRAIAVSCGGDTCVRGVVGAFVVGTLIR